jgi:SHS2 domain-containing protein
MGYEPIDVAGDAGIRATGTTLEEAFRNAVLGMYSLITDLGMVEQKTSINVMSENESLEGLLVDLLNELIYRSDVDGFIGKEAVVEELVPEGEMKRIKILVKGEGFDPERHPGGLLLKAATYHLLKVEKQNNEWIMEIIFDI